MHPDRTESSSIPRARDAGCDRKEKRSITTGTCDVTLFDRVTCLYSAAHKLEEDRAEKEGPEKSLRKYGKQNKPYPSLPSYLAS